MALWAPTQAQRSVAAKAAAAAEKVAAVVGTSSQFRQPAGNLPQPAEQRRGAEV